MQNKKNVICPRLSIVAKPLSMKMTDSLSGEDEAVDNSDNLGIEDEGDMAGTPDLGEFLDDYSDEKDM